MPTRKRSSNDVFTGTQVGALLESLRGEIKLIAEGLAELSGKQFPALRQEVNNLTQRVDDLTMKVNRLPIIEKKVDELADAAKHIQDDLRDVKNRLHTAEEKLAAP